MKVQFGNSTADVYQSLTRPALVQPPARQPVYFGTDSALAALSADQYQGRQKAAELFVKALKNEGVDCIYGVPGEETLDLMEAIRKAGIKFITTRDEESAGFMAATHGRLTGKPGVCLATLGPGATKLSTPAAFATLGGMPMVMITAQKPLKANKQARFQIVDIVRMMEPLTKFARRIEDGTTVPRMVRDAFRQATEGRPGAVHLELPEDVAAEPVDRDTPLFLTTRPQPPVASAQSLNEAAKLLKTAKRPLLLIGSAAKHDPKVGPALEAFLRKTRIPFMTTQMGKGVIDEHHPQYLGTPALSAEDYIHCAIERSDLIINVGHDIEEKPPFLMQPGNTLQKVVHLNNNPAGVDDVYFPQLEVVGDMASSLQSLTDSMTPKPAGQTGGYFQRNIQRMRKRVVNQRPNYDRDFFKKAIDYVNTHVSDNAQGNGFPIIPQRIVSEVQKAMPKDGIISLDNGMYKIWFARNYKASTPQSLLLDNALATMGAGLPAAMEAARLYPQRKVLAICGDGGFMMSSQELETAIREKLNLTILILNDNSYGMIRWKQNAHGLPDYALRFGNPDFVKYAESFGAKGHRVESADALATALQSSMKEGGVHLIEVPVDYSVNQTVMVDELKRKACDL